MAHVTCTDFCNIEPFSSTVEPQDPPTANSISILKDEIQDYLARMRELLCSDLQCIEGHSYAEIFHVVEVELDIPNIIANGSYTVDFTHPGVHQADHVVSFAALTDATSLDDLLLQFMVVAENTVRFVADNPSPGAINPDPITFQFVLAEVRNLET